MAEYTGSKRGTYWALGRVGLSAAIGLCLLSGQSYAQKAGSRITVALEEDIRGLDPRRDRDGMSDPVHMHVVEGLLGYADDLSVRPMLASSYAISEDGKSYTFKLRDGVRFHNGKPLTSAEVKWSWDYVMAADSIWRCKAVFDGPIKVAGVETPDPQTVVFKLDQPNGSFVYNLARTDCAGTPVLHPESADAEGKWKGVIGTGPFQFGERRIGQYIEVKRFPDYALSKTEATGRVGKKEALVETVRFTVVADPSARLVGLRSGDLDITPLTAEVVDQIEKDPKLHVTSSDTTVWYALLFGMNDPILRDVRMRRAIAAAIDRTAVAQGVSFGQWSGTATPVPSASLLYTRPSAEDEAASLTRAKSLLAEAKYSGQPITINANKALPMMFNQAVIIQSMLQAAGINTVIETLEWGLQLDRYTKGTYQAQSFGYSGRFDPMGAWERFIGPESRKVWKDEEAIALLNKGMKTADPAEMKQISDQLYKKFMTDVPAIGLYHVKAFYGVSDRLAGVKASPLEVVRVWNVSIK